MIYLLINVWKERVKSILIIYYIFRISTFLIRHWRENRISWTRGWEDTRNGILTWWIVTSKLRKNFHVYKRGKCFFCSCRNMLQKETFSSIRVLLERGSCFHIDRLMHRSATEGNRGVDVLTFPRLEGSNVSYITISIKQHLENFATTYS